MIPNARLQQNTHDDFVFLQEQIGKPQMWIAERTGISRRRLQYLTAGERFSNGVMVPVRMSYPEQFTLECLAEAARGLD